MKLDILGFTYVVKRREEMFGHEGIVQHKTGEILIADDLGPECSAETMLHEIIHCIEYATNLNLEENEVWCISRGIYTVLRDNPQLVAAIQFREEDHELCEDCREGI